ncbi:hypothetical protein ACLOJK_014402 [Asimina triloba]
MDEMSKRETGGGKMGENPTTAYLAQVLSPSPTATTDFQRRRSPERRLPLPLQRQIFEHSSPAPLPVDGIPRHSLSPPSLTPTVTLFISPELSPSEGGDKEHRGMSSTGRGLESCTRRSVTAVGEGDDTRAIGDVEDLLLRWERETMLGARYVAVGFSPIFSPPVSLFDKNVPFARVIVTISACERRKRKDNYHNLLPATCHVVLLSRLDTLPPQPFRAGALAHRRSTTRPSFHLSSYDYHVTNCR